MTSSVNSFSKIGELLYSALNKGVTTSGNSNTSDYAPLFSSSSNDNSSSSSDNSQSLFGLFSTLENLTSDLIDGYTGTSGSTTSSGNTIVNSDSITSGNSNSGTDSSSSTSQNLGDMVYSLLSDFISALNGSSSSDSSSSTTDESDSNSTSSNSSTNSSDEADDSENDYSDEWDINEEDDSSNGWNNWGNWGNWGGKGGGFPCDPIGFNVNGTRYELATDENGDGKFSGATELVGFNNNWSEMVALDKNNDGHINGDELDNIKLVSGGKNGTVESAADLGLTDIDLDSYKNNKFNATINNRTVKGTQTYESKRKIDHIYRNTYGKSM